MKELDFIKFNGKSVKTLLDVKGIFSDIMSNIDVDSRYPVKLYLETNDGPLKYKRDTRYGKKYLIPSDSILDKDNGYLIDGINYDTTIVSAMITIGTNMKGGQYGDYYDAFMDMDKDHREYHIYVSEQFGVSRFDNKESANKYMDFVH